MPLATPQPWVYEPAWYELPVAVALHPVRYDYGARYQALLAGAMGGATGSPAFGPVVAEADVHWRLLAATGHGLPLTADDAPRWRDAAISGATVAFDALVDETFARAPQLDAVRAAVDAVLSPSLEARSTEGGPLRVAPGTGAARARLDRAEADYPSADAARFAARARAAARPTVRLGVDWRLRDADAPETDPLLSYGAYVSTTRVALTRFRADLSARDLAWSVSARQQLNDPLSLVASARAADPPESARDGERATLRVPGRVAAGLLYVTPTGWELRLEHARVTTDDTWTWTVSARSERRTPIPARIDPPLGARETEEGLPDVPPSGPNVLARW
jgi:hypothetical protein